MIFKTFYYVLLQRVYWYPRPIPPWPSFPIWPLFPGLWPQPPPVPLPPPPPLPPLPPKPTLAPTTTTTPRPTPTPGPQPPQTTEAPRGDNGWTVLIWEQEWQTELLPFSNNRKGTQWYGNVCCVCVLFAFIHVGSIVSCWSHVWTRFYWLLQKYKCICQLIFTFQYSQPFHILMDFSFFFSCFLANLNHRNVLLNFFMP